MHGIGSTLEKGLFAILGKKAKNTRKGRGKEQQLIKAMALQCLKAENAGIAGMAHPFYGRFSLCMVVSGPPLDASL
jgi:hypothetical protein